MAAAAALAHESGDGTVRLACLILAILVVTK